MKQETADNITNKMFKKMRKTITWTAADGRELTVKAMETSHIQNTAIYLAKNRTNVMSTIWVPLSLMSYQLLNG